MGVRVAVAGASGYAGGELLRLIAAHPDLELGPVTAGTKAGAPVTAVHPNLASLAGRAFEETVPALLASADLVFLALPHGESAAVAAGLPGRDRGHRPQRDLPPRRPVRLGRLLPNAPCRAVGLRPA